MNVFFGGWQAGSTQRSLLVLLAMLLGARVSAAADAPVRQSTDKVAFPAAIGPRVLDKKMPLVGGMLGALPEEACNSGKILSMSSELEVVNKLRTRLAEHKINFAAFDFVADGRGGAAYTLIGLADGRVSRVGFFFPEITEAEAQEKVVQFKRIPWEPPGPPVDPTKHRVNQWGVLTLDATRVYSRLSGVHPRAVHAETHPKIGQRKENPPPDRVVLEPSLITIGVDAGDWYILHHALSPEAKEALHQKRLIVGMSKVDAYIALIDYRLGIADRQGTTVEKWTWYKDAHRAPVWMAEESLYSVPVLQSVEKNPTLRCTATLEDGKVKAFHDR